MALGRRFFMAIHPDCVARRNPEDELQKRRHAALTVIFLAVFWESAFFGKVTVSTPFLKLASILSGSTLSGTWKERWNEP